MTFSVNAKILSEAVSKVSRAVAPKSTLPSLEGILIKASNGTIRLTGYDLETGIVTEIPARISKEISVVVNAKLLGEIVRKLSDGEISFSVDDKQLIQIKNGDAEFTILGMPAEEFPELPSVSDCTVFSLNARLLKRMIDQTLFAVAQNDQKPVYTGSQILLKDREIRMVSVDGFRLAMRKEEIQLEQDINFIVPGGALTEISRLISDDIETVEIQVSKKHIIAKIEDIEVISRLLEGEFIDYRSAIPKDSVTEVLVNTREFCESIERVSLLISEKLKNPVKCVFEESQYKISCVTTMGKAIDKRKIELKGEKLEIGFNNKFMLDALKACDGDRVKLLMNGPLAPIKMVPPEGDHFTYLILPVRLKSE